MLTKSIFINNFEKGSSENANIGMGNLVGIDTYSKKGVAMTTRKSTLSKDFSSTSAYPHFMCLSQLGTTLWVQLSDGAVWASTDLGTTWTDTSFTTSSDTSGNGLIFFQGYVFAFTKTKIYYHDQNPATGSWVDWTTAKALGALVSPSTSPIDSLHFPFLYPSSRGIYFGNGSVSGSVGFFGQNGTTTFDPTGTSGTDFIYNGAIFNLPTNTYNIGALNFLPPSNLAISAYAFQDAQSADLITWDTVSSNKFNPPLRLYSNTKGTLTGGIKQLFNRNQVLYCVAGGNHTIYETNGSTFNLVDDIALYSNVRNVSGAETNIPVFFNSYPQAIAVIGNKLLTGISTDTNTSTYPSGTNGIFPFGVWSVVFNQDGTKSSQCEYVLPVGDTTTPDGTGNYAKITSILPIGNGQIAIGYAIKDTTLSSGVAITDISNVISNVGQNAIESPMFEIGTALNPQAINNIEINLVKKLQTYQSLLIYYRKTFDTDWTLLDTLTGDGVKNAYKITSNPIGATQFLQLRIRINNGGGGADANNSPEIRNVKIS